MAKNVIQDLEPVIRDAAVSFAAEFQKRVSTIKVEEEVRIATERQLETIGTRSGIEIDGKHEFTLAKGRVDSVYDGVFIEYKNPASMTARIGNSLSTAGAKAVLKQIKSRFPEFKKIIGRDPSSLLGVGFDGAHFLFVRFFEGQWQVDDPVPLSSSSAERFLWALFNLGQSGKAFTPNQLALDFGASSTVGREGVLTFYRLVKRLASPKAKVLYQQWRVLFGEVCGHDIDHRSPSIAKLAMHYELDSEEIVASDFMFALHTYYALFMKLLCAEILSHSQRMPSVVGKAVKAQGSVKLRSYCEELEAGGIFRHLNVTNFLEGDLFAWYVSEWDETAASAVHGLVSGLSRYNPSTLSEQPENSRDLLKQLYHQLFPKSVRHDLGEYYTPDWLSDFVISKVGYEGDPNTRVLDPACGSGTFLVMLIARVKARFTRMRDRTSITEEELGKLICENIVGFDLNPLAVLAARANYLIAMRDLIPHMSNVEVPVYLCDSIVTPIEFGDLFTGSFGSTKKIKTVAGDFLVPRNVTSSRALLSSYCDILERSVKNRCSSEDFCAILLEERILNNDGDLHTTLFEQMVALDEAKRNGIWARIIKNAFAPVFAGKFDLVVGNPPWVNWESLPEEYRDSTAPIWQRYGLFSHKGLAARLGSGKDDISVLLTYVAHDSYLRKNGKLAFVITQSIFKTKGGGEGFRNLEYPSYHKKEMLSEIEVDDFTAFQPFEDAANRTAVIVVGKSGKRVTFPVPYRVWTIKKGARLRPSESMETAKDKLEVEQRTAEPVDASRRTSPWMTAHPSNLDAIKKARGKSRYRSRKGVYCATNAIFWLKGVQSTKKISEVLITNLADSGKKSVDERTVTVEAEFVHPLIRGRDVGRWRWQTSVWIILPQSKDNPAKAVPESILKVKYPKTYTYFNEFRNEIAECALFKQFFRKDIDPFYSSYNVGPYTMAPYLVAWKEVATHIQAAVIDQSNDGQIAIPDHKLVFVSLENEEEAFYLAGLLNSSLITAMVRAYALQTSISGHIFEYAAIPPFKARNSIHGLIAKLSRRCHELQRANELDDLVSVENEINAAVNSLFGIDGSSQQPLTEPSQSKV